MKKYTITILGVFFTINLLAECSMSGLWAYPSSKSISSNSIIMVEGYSFSQRIVDSLNISYPAYLQTDDHRIDLEVVDICIGEYQLTQAVLQPKQSLVRGKSYQLKIGNLSDWEQKDLRKWNSLEKRYEPISWIVDKKDDQTEPMWAEMPKLSDRSTIWYGCGPAIYATFELQVQDQSQTFVTTELYDVTQNKVCTYHLPISENGKLNVGHGMCSGAFFYLEKGEYQIRFSLLDMSGNTNSNWTEWISFKSPFKEFNFPNE